MSAVVSERELFPYLFATWVFELHVAGISADDIVLRDACAAIRAASDKTAGDRASEALVARIREIVTRHEPADVRDAAKRLYGQRVKDSFGGEDRAERTSHIRKYEFSHKLPWLARIWQRSADGSGGQTVAPTWLLVERVNDEVHAADPNPWNEVDEAHRLPINDFLVLWELDGCSALYIDSEST